MKRTTIKLLMIVTLIQVLFSAAANADYENNFIGTCDANKLALKAKFYIRNNDKHFQFEFVDAQGKIVEDKSVLHRQNIFTEKHGIKNKNGKIVLKETEEYYDGKFIYKPSNNTAVFSHSYSCTKEWFDRPCRVYVEDYQVEFTNCTLDFTPYLDR